MVKDVVFGIACPPEMQAALTRALRNTSPNTKLVTIIVNLTKHPTAMQTELETLKQIDAIDPAGEFTAKLFYEEVLEPTRRWFRGSYTNPYIDIVLNQLEKDDKSSSLIQHYALNGCVCGSGLHDRQCCKLHDANCSCERCMYEDLRGRMQDWSTKVARLHFIFMEFAGESLATLVVDSLAKPTLYTGFRRLLGNYSKLHANGISHLDLHDGNLTWSVRTADSAVASAVEAAQLHIKFIDFGFHRTIQTEHDSDAYLQRVQPDKHRRIMDVTKWFTLICDVSVSLRWWHPIEYPMFHLCASLLLAPLLLPGERWTRQHHVNKVKHLAAVVVTNNLVQSQVMDYGSFTKELLHFFRKCPLMASDPDHNECKRFAFFGGLFSIFGAMRHCYKLILPLFQGIWVRVCSIVGAELSRTRFWPDDRPRDCGASPHNVCQSGTQLFALYHGYQDALDVFRTQYYFCTHLDLATVEREFDTFSLAMNILMKKSNSDVGLRKIVYRYLLSSTSFESNRTKLADTVAALRPKPSPTPPLPPARRQKKTATTSAAGHNRRLGRLGTLGELGELSECGKHGCSPQAAARDTTAQLTSVAEEEGDEISL